MSSSSGSDGKPAKKRDKDVAISGFESKSLWERYKEWKEAEKAAKDEGLPRAQAKHFFVSLLSAQMLGWY